MKLCLLTLLLVSNVLLAQSELIVNKTKLTSEEEKQIVNVIKVTPDDEQMKKDKDYLRKLAKVVGEGIEEVAKEFILQKGSTAQPSTTQPSTAQPSTTQPSTAQPSTTQPSTAQPSTAQPSTAAPVAAAEGGAAKEGEEKRPAHVRARRAEKKEDPATTVASTAEELPPLTTVLVIRSDKGVEDLDFSKPIEFYVKTEWETIDGEKLRDKASDIKTAIEKMANLNPKDPVKLTVTVVSQGMAAWAIVLIVIAVLLVVGAAGYFVITYFRKQQGNSF